MPWEKDFYVELAVDDAMKVFWMKGYEATSISDLVKAMNINKGSLYNAFGNKKALFIRALLKYDRQNRQALLRRLEAMDDPLAAIQALFDAMIEESLGDREFKGCLLVNTAIELPHHTGDVRDIVSSALGDFEGFFSRMVRRAQDNGQASDRLDADTIAKSLLSQVVGLRVLSRGVFDAQSLEAVRAQALSFVKDYTKRH